MEKVIIAIIFAGMAIAVATFTINPFRKRAGVLIVLLGIIASFTLRLMIGLPMVGIGVLLLVIHFIYHRYC